MIKTNVIPQNASYIWRLSVLITLINPIKYDVTKYEVNFPLADS